MALGDSVLRNRRAAIEGSVKAQMLAQFERDGFMGPILVHGPSPVDDSEEAEREREHRAELVEWDAEFERQTGKHLWRRV